MKLVRLRAGHLGVLREMALSFQREGDARLQAVLDDPMGYLESARRDELELGLPAGRVGQTHYLLFDGHRLVGGSRLRYRLSPTLLRDGGHVGYEIRRSERGRGLGHAILRLTLDEARGRGLSRILLTAGQSNEASIRVIESNGGIADGISTSPRTGEVMRRFWIEL